MSSQASGLVSSDPKRRRKHLSYNESVDEATGLLESEPVDIEEALPSEPNEPVESIDEKVKPGAPAFEE